REGLDKCQKLSKEVRQRRAALIPSCRNGWYHDMLAFQAGELSADDLLKKAGSSRLNLCEAYHYIAHRRLAEGDRAGARGSYQRSYETGVYSYGEYCGAGPFSRSWMTIPTGCPLSGESRRRKPEKVETSPVGDKSCEGAALCRFLRRNTDLSGFFQACGEWGQ